MSELVIKNRLGSATSISFHYIPHSYSPIWNNMTYFGVKARAVESESEGILGGVGVGRNF
jgi:hypothetical protein